MQSLNSKGYVKTQFSWQWYYYTLTEEGLAYLREFLHLPSEIVPQTHMKPVARQTGRPSGQREGGYRAPRGDREYRRRDDGEKEGGEYRPVRLSVTIFDISSFADFRAAIRRCCPWCPLFLSGFYQLCEND